MRNSCVYEMSRVDLLPHLPADLGRVLDVGCATGGFGRTLKAAQPASRIWGIEPDPRSADLARTAGYEQVVEGSFPTDVMQLDCPRFNAIAFLDVLEHVTDPEGSLRQAADALLPGGVVLASIPNVRHVTVWWPLIRRGDWTYTDSGLLDRTHLRWFTRSGIERLFTDAGYRVIELKGINRSQSGGFGEVGRAVKVLGKLTRGRSNEFFWMQYYVAAERS